MRIVVAVLIAAPIACTQTKELPPAGDAAGVSSTQASASPAAVPNRVSDRGQAPSFTLKDLDGKEVSLSQFAGKTVVLEWFNPDCPFVSYSHRDGPLKSMAERAMASDDSLVWLAINSGAPGKQGHGIDRNKKAVSDYGIDYPVLVDEDGAVGKAYEAKTTPHMFIINGQQQLEYAGALDTAPMGRTQGNASINYVENALASLAKGQPVDPSRTKPYGCSVKYGS